jgi:hypothetical protein
MLNTHGEMYEILRPVVFFGWKRKINYTSSYPDNSDMLTCHTPVDT